MQRRNAIVVILWNTTIHQPCPLCHSLSSARLLQEFVGGSGQAGVVYVSLGTVCSIGPQEFRELAAALSALPARVIWKVGADDLPEGVTLPSLGLADNVKVCAQTPIHLPPLDINRLPFIYWQERRQLYIYGCPLMSAGSCMLNCLPCIVSARRVLVAFVDARHLSPAVPAL